MKHALGAGIAGDHALAVVIGVMGEHLDGDEIAGVDFELGCERPAEIAPVDGLGRRRQMVVARRVPWARRRWAGGRSRRHPPRRGRAPRLEIAVASSECSLPAPMSSPRWLASRTSQKQQSFHSSRRDRRPRRNRSSVAPGARLLPLFSSESTSYQTVSLKSVFRIVRSGATGTRASTIAARHGFRRTRRNSCSAV